MTDNQDVSPVVYYGNRGDFRVACYGGLVGLLPLTQRAWDWAKANLPAETRRWSHAFAVEPRAIDDILAAVTEDGLTVEE